MRAGRIVNAVFVFAFIAVGLVAAVYLFRDYQHLDHLESEKRILENRHEALRAETEAQEERLKRLEGDSEYVEKVIREKLNYVKEDEDVFRFE